MVRKGISNRAVDHVWEQVQLVTSNLGTVTQSTFYSDTQKRSNIRGPFVECT